MPSPPRNLDVENVLILVGDAVRYDYAAEKLATRGLTYKTISASLHTPTSFATMLSGQHPTQHGVYGFHQQLPTDDHLFSLDGYTTGFLDGPADMNDWLARRQRLFGRQEQFSLSEVSSPYLLVERDFGGHAPYMRYSNDGDPGDVSHGEYFKRHAGDVEFFRGAYERSIDTWLERVDERLAELERRGERENTLVVLTSDHGEVLGEYGHMGHDYPAIPALVEVPTAFVHPDIEPGVVDEGVARHVDFVPTLLAYLDEAIPGELPGHPIQRNGPAAYGVCYYNRAINDYFRRVGVSVANKLPKLEIEIESVWDADGGYCFNRSSLPEKLLVYLFRTTVLPQGRTIIKQRAFTEAYRTLVSDGEQYGDPSFGQAAAEAILEREFAEKSGTEYTWDLDRESEDQLEALGYL